MNNNFDRRLPAGPSLAFDEGSAAQDAGANGAGEASIIDPRAVFAAIRRNIKFIIAIMVAAVALGIVATILMVPKFVGTARVLIEQQADQIIEGADARAAPAYQDADRFLQTQVDIIKSRGLAERVVEQENLAEKPEFFEAQGAEIPVEEDLEGATRTVRSLEQLREELAIDIVQENLSVNLPPDSRIVSIGFESGDPNLAARIANSFAESLVENNLSRKFDSSSYAREFLAQQLQDARSKLEQSERDLNQFSRAAGLIRVAGQGQNADQETTLSVTNDTLIRLNSVAAEATAERLAAEQVWLNVSGVPVLSVPQVLQNPAVQRTLEQKSAAEAQLAELQSRYLEDHPTVLAAQAQVDKLDTQIDGIANSIVRSVELQYKASLDREQSVKNQVENLRSAALDEQDRGVQYNVLKRVAETDRALYNTLLTRFNEINAMAGATSNNISIVDLAQAPRKPSSPRPLLNLIASMFFGVIMAGGFVFFREQFDDAMRTPEDVEKKLGLPLLGLIPKASEENVFDELEDPKSPISESYSALLTNMRYSSATGIPETLTITSSQAGEGKTTTAAKLAQEIAELGRKTLLIDADLRRPTMHKRENVGSREGFTTVLAGEKTIDEVIFQSDVPNLSLMTAMPIPPDPVALLVSQRFEELLSELRERFDCVIFDAPPMLGLADSAMLAAHTDAVAMVIDSGRGSGGGTRSAIRRLRMVNANVIGVVLTKFDARQSGGQYSYYGSDYYTYEHSTK